MIRTSQTAEWRILVPVHEGRCEHAILMPMHYWNESLIKYDGRGLRGVFELPLTTSGILEDIDTREGYRRVLKEST